jgi:hypothetical protein
MLTRPAPLDTRSGGARVDIERMIASGCVEGPYTPTRPLTLTLRVRVARALRRTLRKILR